MTTSVTPATDALATSITALGKTVWANHKNANGNSTFEFTSDLRPLLDTVQVALGSVAQEVSEAKAHPISVFKSLFNSIIDVIIDSTGK